MDEIIQKKLEAISCLVACFPNLFLALHRKGFSEDGRKDGKKDGRKDGRKDRRKGRRKERRKEEMTWNSGDLFTIQGTQNYCNVNTFVLSTHQSPLPPLLAIPDLNSTYLQTLCLFNDP